MMWFFVELVVFGRACGFWASLWFFAGLVVFCLACGFWASLWFFAWLVFFLPGLWFLGEIVDLRSDVVVKGKPKRDLTTESMLC